MSSLEPEPTLLEVEPLGMLYDRIISNSRIIWSEQELGGSVIEEVGGEDSPDVYLSLRDRDICWDGVLPLAITKRFANDPIGVNNAWKELDAILATWATQHKDGKPVTREQRWEHFWNVSDLEGGDLQRCLYVLKWKATDHQKESVFRGLMVKYKELSVHCNSILMDHQDIEREVEAEQMREIWNNPEQIAYRQWMARLQSEREERRRKNRQRMENAALRRHNRELLHEEKELQKLKEGQEVQEELGTEGDRTELRKEGECENEVPHEHKETEEVDKKTHEVEINIPCDSPE